jgi:hypothetical protein
MKSEHFMAAGCIALTVLLMVLMGYQLRAFHTYPCEAFKQGHLSLGYAPARCIR